MALAENIIVE